MYSSSSSLSSYGKKPVALQGGGEKGEKFWKPQVHKMLMKRRAAISAEATFADDLKALAARKFDKSQEVADLIYDVVSSTIAFRTLDESDRREVVKNMWAVEYAKKDKVISENDPMRMFYVIVKGSFDYVTSQSSDESKNDDSSSSRSSFASTTSSVLQTGDSFGEIALLYDSTSTHTVTAREDSLCFAYDRASYKKMIASTAEKRFSQRVNFLRSSPLFGQLPNDLINKMAEALEEKHYKAGEIIIRQDEPGDSFYIIMSGSALAVRDGAEVHRYERAGEYFGERALVKNETRGATIHAVTPVTVLYLTRKDFTNLMGKMEETFEKGVRKFSILNRSLFVDSEGNVSDASAAAVAAAKAEAENEAKTTGEEGSGSGSNTNASKQFGGIKMHFGGDDESSSTSPEAEVKQQQSTRRECPVKSLADLKVIGTLGRGTFGHVQLVSDNQENTYALKAVNKSHVVKHNQIPHILNERAVMLDLDHPFVVKLYSTMRDQNYLYFLLEPSLGGELFSALRARDRFDSDTARFYAAIVVTVFQYMHSLDILYRDLKPENLLMDSDGYLRVTDFGFAKKTKDRTYTFCGTPDYLAPEIVASAGHHTGADWWTLGILIFEMLAGYTPFYDDNGPTSMYSKILSGKLCFPAYFTPEEQNLVASLLQTKPTRRLGVLLGGADLIKQHEWFKKLDWNALLQKRIEPPIKVQIKNKFDLSNFDSYPEEENMNEPFVPDPANPDWDKDF